MSFNAFDISASGLYAQRVRMDTISSNIANVNTTRNPDGSEGVYVRKKAVFASVYNNQIEDTVFAKNYNGGDRNLFDMNNSFALKGSIEYGQPSMSGGVQVSQIAEDGKDSFRMVYEPGHPDADENGMVKMPNVNVVTEMVDMISASRAYEANVQAMNATKGLISSALKI